MASASESAQVAAVPAVVQRLTAAFATGKTRSVAWRRQQLQQLLKLLKENRAALCAAVAKDLGSFPEIVNVFEVGATVQEAENALAHLDEWVKPESKAVPALTKPSTGYIVKEPFGVSLIMGAWNYPLRLVFFPMIGALAAGNAVLLKPSEVAANASEILKRLSDRYFDPEAIACIEGGPAISQAILRERFDKIFYTGNTEVGRIVMRAAAEHLTPVTLELGGKSPAYVSKTANLDVSVNRLLFGKFANNGQTCVAPDYILVDHEIKDALIAKLRTRITEWYGEDASKSPDYSRIINQRHAARITSYLDECRDNIVFGGRTDPANRFIEPTIVLEPPRNSKLLRDEIFGPILPVLSVAGPDEAIQYIRSRPKPLAMYIFSSDQASVRKVIDNTSSGNVGVNVTLFQISCPEMEFGGVGPSGLGGGYNGRHSFDTFSHRRAVLDKATWLELKSMYPPLNAGGRKALDRVADGIKLPPGVVTGGLLAVAAAAAYAVAKL